MRQLPKPPAAKTKTKSPKKSAPCLAPRIADDDLPISTEDPKLKFLEGLTPRQVDFHETHWRIRNTLHYTRTDSPAGLRAVARKRIHSELTRGEQLRVRLRDVQDLCRRLGWPIPVGLTESCEPHYGKDAVTGRYQLTPGRATPAGVTVVASPPASGPAPTGAKRLEPLVPVPALPPPVKKVGIIARIVEVLRAASKKAPVTKEQVWEALKRTFPERDPRAMRSTVWSQVPSCLRTEKGLECQTDGTGGFWLPVGEKK